MLRISQTENKTNEEVNRRVAEVEETRSFQKTLKTRRVKVITQTLSTCYVITVYSVA